MRKILSLMLPVLFVFSVHAQHLPIGALKIGDEVPDLLIRPVLNQPDSVIRLSDLHGKLVVLDFWGQYCGPCISALPVLDSLQQQHADQVAAIAIAPFEDTAEAGKVLRKFPKLKGLRLPVAVEDETVKAHFPYSLISHVVWIAPDGRVLAFTGSDYFTAERIREALAGETGSWVMKNDVLDFDETQALLAVNTQGAVPPEFYFYSSLTGHIGGIAPPNGIRVDSLNGIRTICYYNTTLSTLCQLAAAYKVGARRGAVVLEVPDTAAFYKPEDTPLSEWEAKHTYCYSLRLPIQIPEKDIPAIVRTDLSRWLSMIGYTAEALLPDDTRYPGKRYVIRDAGYAK